LALRWEEVVFVEVMRRGEAHTPMVGLLPPLDPDADPTSPLEPSTSHLDPSTSQLAPIHRARLPAVTSADANAFEFDETTAAGATCTGWRELQARLEQEGVHVHGGWAENHYRWIVWKLACQQRLATRADAGPAPEDDAFDDIEQQEFVATEHGSEDTAMWQDGWEDDYDDGQYAQHLRAELERSDAVVPSAHARPPAFSSETVLRQLRERHALESRGSKSGHLPVLRKVLERWPEVGEGAHMVLCVAGFNEEHGTVELTDGWYSAWAGCDEPLRAQLARRRLRVGAKLRVCCMEWKGDPDPDTPLWRADPAVPRLGLRANGTRRAAPDAVLGLARRAFFRVALASLQRAGGRAPCVQVRVLRVHGPLYLRDCGDDKREWLTPNGYEAAQARREQEHVDRMERRAYDAVPGGGDGEDDDDGGGGDTQAGGRVSCKWMLEVVDLPAAGDPRRAVGGGGGVGSGKLSDEAAAAADAAALRGVVALWGDQPEMLADMGVVEGGCCELRAVQRVDDPPREQTVSSSGGAAVVLNVKASNVVPFQSAAAVAAGRGRAYICSLPPHLARRYQPLSELVSLPTEPGPLFDTVGVLVLCGAAVPGRWPGLAERSIWLADDSCDLLMVRWTYNEAEPLPKLRVGQPVALRNARYVTCTRFVPPPGSEHLACDGGRIRLHMCEADALSRAFPAEVGAGSLPRAFHLKPHATRLTAEATSLRENGHLPQLAALAAAVMAGKLIVAQAQPLAGTPQQPQPQLQPMQLQYYAPPQPYMQLLNQRQPQPQPQLQPQPRLPATAAATGPTLHAAGAASRGELDTQTLTTMAKLLHGFVILYFQSRSEGASAAEVVHHCTSQGLLGDAVTVQRVLDTLVEDVQLYRNQQGLYAAL
jgi:hypothetical protein